MVDKIHIEDQGESSSSSENEEANTTGTSEECLMTEDDFYKRKSVQIKKYSKSISEEWDMSKERLRKSMVESPETDLTGPDYCEDPVENTTDLSSSNNDTDNLTTNHKTIEDPVSKNEPLSGTHGRPIVKNNGPSHSPKTTRELSTKKNSPRLDYAAVRTSSVTNTNNNSGHDSLSGTKQEKGQDSPVAIDNGSSTKSPTYKTPSKETAIFYAKLEKGSAENSPRPSLGEDALLSEGIETVENTECDTEKKLYAGAAMIGGPPSPTDQQKPKLWSCFPAIKSGSKRNSYKMVMQSPPYMPVSRENTSR